MTIPSGLVYLGDEDTLAVGFNMNAGGSIGSLLYKGREMVDRADFGRYIQLSFYDGDDSYAPSGNDPFGNWGWNPIQAGSKAYRGAEVLEYRATEDSVYIKATGKEWGERDVDSDVIFETWAWMRESYFELLVRATHIGTDYHAKAKHEFPAAYFASSLTRQFSYMGSAPFTNQPVTDLSKYGNYYSCPEVRPSENWIAYGSGSDFALILAAPPQPFLTNEWALCLFTHVSPYVGYTAPLALFDTPRNAIREAHYYLIPGSIDSGRGIVYDLIPHTTWTFDLNSLEGWRSQSEAFVEEGVLSVALSQEHRMTSSGGLNIVGAITPSVTVDIHSQENESRVCLQFITTKDPIWDAEKASCMTVFPGQFQSLSFNLGENSQWLDGVITQLGLSALAPSGVRIDSIVVDTIGYAWEFESDGDNEGWVAWNQLTDLQVTGSYLVTMSTGTDPHIASPTISVDAEEYPIIQIHMKVSSGIDAQLFFVTEASSNYEEEKSLRFKVRGDGRFHIYSLDMSSVPGWEGTVSQIRFDPIENKAKVVIDYIRIVDSTTKCNTEE